MLYENTDFIGVEIAKREEVGFTLVPGQKPVREGGMVVRGIDRFFTVVFFRAKASDSTPESWDPFEVAE